MQAGVGNCFGRCCLLIVVRLRCLISCVVVVCWLLTLARCALSATCYVLVAILCSVVVCCVACNVLLCGCWLRFVRRCLLLVVG